MLIVNLIKQDVLKGIRSTGFYKNLAGSIFYGLMGIYFLSIFLFLGFNLDKILFKSGSSFNPLLQVNGAMLYTLLTGLTFRFIMQSLETFNLPPYQVLNIRRRTLVNFIILKPLFHPLNYWSLLIMVPFAIKYVALYYGSWKALSLVWTYTCLICFNSLLTAFLKRKFGPSLKNTIILIALFLVVIGLEYFNLFSLTTASRTIFGFLILHPAGWIAASVTVVAAYGLNRWFFSQNYYAETFNKFANKSKAIMTDFALLNRFGVEGELILMELKLILRHKRTKSVLFTTGLFLFYGLIFYPQKIYQDSNGTLFFVALFVTGLAMIMFGQWLISWDSSHFDGLMTKNVPAKTYMQANYYMMTAFATISFVLTIPYFLFGWKITFMHITAFIYNIGINVFVLLFCATYNTKRIDLSKSSAMNYQGVSLKNFLVMLPMLALPITLVWLLSTFFSLTVALSTLAGMGILGIVFTRPLLKLCVQQFQNRKYALAEGYRQSE